MDKRPEERTIRRAPSQRRSRERRARILETARQLIELHGSDALRMSEVAQRAGIGIGSLYQYFPDKAAIIATLVEGYNADGRACTAHELATVQAASDLIPALTRIAASFCAMYRASPVMRDLWAATQADKGLQDLEAADGAAHTAMLEAALSQVRPDSDPARRRTVALLTMHLLASTVRLAITLERAQGDALLEIFATTVLGNVFQPLDEPA